MAMDLFILKTIKLYTNNRQKRGSQSGIVVKGRGKGEGKGVGRGRRREGRGKGREWEAQYIKILSFFTLVFTGKKQLKSGCIYYSS